MITDPFINLRSSGLAVDLEKASRIYWRFGTGVPLSQEHKPFITRYIYAFVMVEDAGMNVVYFSYGA